MSGSNGQGGGGVEHGNIMEMLKDIQAKMKRQEDESLELREQVTRLEQHNEQLREDSCVWQRECERLRSEIAAKGTTALDQTDRDDRYNSNRTQGWQEEIQRLQTRLNALEQENARLRAEMSKSEQLGCCCFQLCQLLFRSKNRNGENAAVAARSNLSTSSSSDNYYNNRGVRVQQ